MASKRLEKIKKVTLTRPYIFTENAVKQIEKLLRQSIVRYCIYTLYLQFSNYYPISNIYSIYRFANRNKY